MTTFDRRSFFKTSCFAVCASAAAAGSSLAAVVTARFTRKLDAPLPLNGTEEAVLEFVGQYGTRVRLVGFGVLLKLRGTETREAHLLVEVSDPGAFDAALAGPTPFDGAYSEGNTLFFIRDGIEFTVENLLPGAFAQRLTELATLRSIAFAHDALTYDPAARSLVDPFGAEKHASLKLVNGTTAGGAAIGVAMRGRLEALRTGTSPDAQFTAWQNRHLRLGASKRSAPAVAEAVLARLATFAEAITADAMKALLRSRSVGTAFLRVFGLKIADVIAEFDRLRPEIGGEFSDAALWLALLLGPEIESEAADGAATTWTQRGTRFEVLRSRKAVSAARQLVTFPAFAQS